MVPPVTKEFLKEHKHVYCGKCRIKFCIKCTKPYVSYHYSCEDICNTSQRQPCVCKKLNKKKVRIYACSLSCSKWVKSFTLNPLANSKQNILRNKSSN